MNSNSRTRKGPAVLLLGSAMKVKPRVKRTLLVISSAIVILGFIWFAAIATPTQYRVGFWRKFPLLDHRLLPHVSAIFDTNPRGSHPILDFETGAALTKADPQDTFVLRKATDGLYTCVDRTLPRLADAIKKVEQLRRSMFPEKKPLQLIHNSPVSAG